MPFPLPARVLSGTVTGDAPDWTAVLLASRGTRAPGIVAVQEPLARPEQIGLLAQIGQAAMLAFDSLRLYTEEHNLALTLQRSFLPEHAARASSGWRSRHGTSRPPTTPRSVATSTSSSSSTTGGC